MSSNHPAIRVSHLSKQYKLGGPQEPYHTIRDAIVNSLKAPLKIFHTAPPMEGFWALKDVSFEVEPGEVVGIIGRNGAGKSTLLKILSRITSPTEGTVELHGRVGSLLEVGTGFHPELTGRENIYLSGSILGMKRREIDAKLDDIVKFSEIERFLDTPVKRYSSGMYVRLAFAVAAHLEPEILLVDEVLAVGDLAFQKKCLGKMGDIAQEGRTVVFVSHNLSAIANLCSRSILLNSGEIECIGETKKVVDIYIAHSEFASSFDLRKIKHEDRPRKYVLLTQISLFNEDMKPTYTFYMGGSIIARIELLCVQKMENAEIGFKITSTQGLNIHFFPSVWEGLEVNLVEGKYVIEVEIPRIYLYPGKYFINCWVSKPQQYSDDLILEIGLIEVLSNDINGHSPYFEKYGNSGCEVYAPSKWKIISHNP